MQPEYPRRIAFVGPIGSGKTECSRIYIRNQEGAGVRVAIADGLRAEVAEALNLRGGGLSRRDLMDRDKKEEFRDLLVWWGQYRRRTVSVDYWLNRALEAIDMKPEALVVAVDDCRFPNEYDALKDRGFVFVRLQAEDLSCVQTVRDATRQPGVPESENHHPFFECDLFLPWAGTVNKRIKHLKEMLSE